MNVLVKRNAVDVPHGARPAVFGHDRGAAHDRTAHDGASGGRGNRKYKILHVLMPIYTRLDHLKLGQQARLRRSYVEVMVSVLIEHVYVAGVADGTK